MAGTIQVSRLVFVVLILLASYQTLAQTQGKERTVQHPVFYRTVQVDGLSIFFREAGPKTRPRSSCCTDSLPRHECSSRSSPGSPIAITS